MSEQDKLNILEALDFFLENQSFPDDEDWLEIKNLRDRLQNEWRPK